MAEFYVTAIRKSPQKHEDRAVPMVVSINTDHVVNRIPINNGTSNPNLEIKVQQDRHVTNILAAETLGEYTLMSDFNNAASSPYNTGVKANVAAAGTAQATATAITAYHNSVTAACASPSLFGVKLPNASTTGNLRKAIVVKNGATAGIQVYAAASEYLDSSSASTSSATINPGQFKHFYCSATNKWVTCKGPQY